MKKLIKYTISIAAVLLMFASCEKNDPILFEAGDSFIAFERPSGTVSEATDGVENVIEIRVMVVTLNNQALTVNFDFSTEGIANPAVENDAFVLLNTSKTLSFSNGMGYETIRIKTIDDDVFTGNRSVNIVLGTNSAGYPNGTTRSFRLTIVDDEHPLNVVIGPYRVTGPGRTSASIDRMIPTSPVEGNLGQVSFRLVDAVGFSACPEFLIYADVDVDEQTFNIKAGQSFASFNACGGPDYGPSKVAGFDGETDARLEDGVNIRATFDNNGNIDMLDEFGVIITEGQNINLFFALWKTNVVWTKQSKSIGVVDNSKADENQVLGTR